MGCATTSKSVGGFPKQGKEALVAGQTVALAYSGFRPGQHPDRGDGAVLPSDAEILEDLQLLQRHFRLLRLYDANTTSRRTLALIRANKLPIKVMLGIWLQAEVSNHEGCEWLKAPIPKEALEKNTLANAQEIERAIALANEFKDIVVAVNVGNEALVSWNDHMVTLEATIRYIEQVKGAIAQPVTVADNYVVWAENPKLGQAVDFASVHTYPAWEKKDIDEALAFTIENLEAVRKANPKLPIAIGEAGWATVASEFGARASQTKQKRYYQELMGWARTHNVTVFFFEAFDEDWKGNPADPLGAEKHWGLFTKERRPKLVAQPLYPELPPAPADP